MHIFWKRKYTYQ